jgi:hypothetical protein
MMPQREASESIHDPADHIYGKYEGNQAYAHQYETSYEQPLKEGTGAGGKVYPQPGDNKNMFTLLMFVIAMVTLLLCAVLFIFFLGGTGGWIGFVVAAGVIFLVAVVAIEKIK